jgi:hypothetical protein
VCISGSVFAFNYLLLLVFNPRNLRNPRIFFFVFLLVFISVHSWFFFRERLRN